MKEYYNRRVKDDEYRQKRNEYRRKAYQKQKKVSIQSLQDE